MTWGHSLANYCDSLLYRVLRLIDRVKRDSTLRMSIRRCTTFPPTDAIQAGVLYLTRVGRINKWISFRCPRNCDSVIRLSLSTKESPHWRLKVDWLGRVSLLPSIRQLKSCGCHFWIRKSRFIWVTDRGSLETATPKLHLNEFVV